jgi:hypothetical protein
LGCWTSAIWKRCKSGFGLEKPKESSGLVQAWFQSRTRLYAEPDKIKIPRSRAPTILKTSKPLITKPSPRALQRAVASSTAVETGRSVALLEKSLQQAPTARFAHIKLAR